jgi:polyisoprenoid-binding protein YceI
MNKSVLVSLLSFASVGLLSAAPQSFDFKDPKGVNAIQFHLDSLLEPISGSANGVTGTVSFDVANPAATSGKIVVATNTLTVTNSMMTEHLRGEKWLNAAANPEIVFALTKLEQVKTMGNDTTAIATGDLTIKGVTKSISVPIKMTYLADALGKRTKPENKGDLLVIRGEFSINRSDYGIMPGQMEDKVNPEIQLTLGIVGAAPKA